MYKTVMCGAESIMGNDLGTAKTHIHRSQIAHSLPMDLRYWSTLSRAARVNKR